MNLVRLIALLLVSSVFTARQGAAEQINFGPLANEDPIKREAVVGNCEREKTHLKCEFTQTTIRRKLDPEKAESELPKLLNEAAKELPKVRDDSLCKDREKIRESIEKQRVALKGQEADAFSELSRMTDAFLSLCDNPTMANAENALRLSLRKETETCAISSFSYTDEFELQPDGRWISNKGPTGTCSFINIGILTQERDLVWTYETRRVMTKPVEGEQCSGYGELTARYSVQLGDKVLSCKFIRFGF
jgi:hypothetical protein